MACVELILIMQSPTLAAVMLLSGFLPFMTTIIHHDKGCEEIPLPMRRRDPPPTITMSGSSDTPVVSNQVNSEWCGDPQRFS
ncbi:hypothetical protein OG21DRAFT_1506474 [Imleria badia]|nr:hypothetical protein OG21DRAFT_1506474 [Imleria badia]